jgi:hypothetical protein
MTWNCRAEAGGGTAKEAEGKVQVQAAYSTTSLTLEKGHGPPSRDMFHFWFQEERSWAVPLKCKERSGLGIREPGFYILLCHSRTGNWPQVFLMYQLTTAGLLWSWLSQILFWARSHTLSQLDRHCCPGIIEALEKWSDCLCSKLDLAEAGNGALPWEGYPWRCAPSFQMIDNVRGTETQGWSEKHSQFEYNWSNIFKYGRVYHMEEGCVPLGWVVMAVLRWMGYFEGQWIPHPYGCADSNNIRGIILGW